MPLPNLIDCVARGLNADKPARSADGWALTMYDPDPPEWDESAIHVSDYMYSLPPSEGGCDRQLWHRLRGDHKEEPTLWERLRWKQGIRMQELYSWLINQGLPKGWEIEAVEMDISEGLPYDHIGSCDLVLRGAGMILGTEFKTQRGKSFRYLDEPKDSHVMQARGELYALRRLYPDMEVMQRIMYIDREGSNRPLVFPVEENDELIEMAAWDMETIKDDVVESKSYPNEPWSGPPDPIAPEITVRENKTVGNSIKVKQQWPCDYCSYRGKSCPGGLPDEVLGLGIVARGDHTDTDSLEWEVEGELRSVVEQGIAQAVQAGNITTK